MKDKGQQQKEEQREGDFWDRPSARIGANKSPSDGQKKEDGFGGRGRGSGFAFF
jgi:hypothetical protein